METLLKRKLSIDEYHRMVEAGIIQADERVELIHGEIIEMSPIGDKHLAIAGRINALLTPRLLGSCTVHVHSPVKIRSYSEPEPDLMVTPYRNDYYAQTGIYPQDVLLLIEVADTSIGKDINIKIPLYAEAGIPEVWIIDVNQDQVLQYTSIKDNSYRHQLSMGREEMISATKLSLEVAIKDLIG